MNGDRERLRPWLALWRAPGIGSLGFRELLERQGSPEAVLANPPPDLDEAAREWLRRDDWPEVEADLDWLEGPGNHLLTLDDPRYPGLLREIPDPPPLLFVHGDPDLLAWPQLAMVGSRNPSAGGAATAAEFAEHLCGAGLAITSGLALGIDAASHEGALRAGGPTIAVTGTGLDRVYPARHHELAHRIAEQGVLVSEFPPGTPPKAENFPRRNRIISGLSLGTLVVEAAVKSGSLITARLAAEQGREVFAIPGSIHNPLARGCHRLIRQGAKLVETAEDILEELGALAAASAERAAPEEAPLPFAPDPEHQALLDLMGHDPVSVDELVERSGLTPEAVSSMLLILELDDRVAAAAGGRYVRTLKERPK